MLTRCLATGCSSRIASPLACRSPEPLYNDLPFPYNDQMGSAEYVMTVSRNGQVSIPAKTRARWNSHQVIVVDLGDHVVIRPASSRPIADLEGKYRGRGQTADRARARERVAEQARGRRR
jgi:bifunctional DNA-binding transcriptional regulator/antitoxin component of YhaV-PrlF toxin-antitoxin module